MEFDKQYYHGKLHDVVTEITRKNNNYDYPIMMISASKGFINQSEKYSTDNAGTSKSKYIHLKKGELAYNHGNSKVKKYGAVFMLEQDNALVPFVYHCFSINKNQNSKYWAYYLNTIRHDRYLRKIVCSTARLDGLLNISSEDYFKMPVNYPELEEQSKITRFLDLLYRKIELIEAKINTLKKYKKGIKKIVVKNSIKYWKNTSLNGINLMNYLVEIKEYNENDGAYVHVTLSKEGISTKTERYDRDFLVKSDDKKYRITRTGQLCYNPANLKFGVICLNNYGTGIFSPIYVTFKIKNIVPEYLELIVTSNDFINYSMRYQQGTVYERMSVSVEDFLKIKISPLDTKEQLKYAKISYCIDKKISKFDNELMILQKFKNNLLNKLFI